MKKILSVVLILFSATCIFAQITAPKPLTQAEYVKMLYSLEKNPGTKDEVVEAIRRRGIAFELTDGLRSLTVSKSRNDADLRRTLEEAARRKANPEKAKLPSEKEGTEILAKAREATLAAVNEMPDFVVKQQIARSAAYAGTNNFRNLDRLVVAVSYRAEGREEYRILSRNGILETNPQQKQSYEDVGGTSSTGEFVTVLAKILNPTATLNFSLLIRT